MEGGKGQCETNHDVMRSSSDDTGLMLNKKQPMTLVLSSLVVAPLTNSDSGSGQQAGRQVSSVDLPGKGV